MAENVVMQFVKVKKIKQLSPEDVYNLEAEKYHNFAINGGLIVHNCMDSMRYALMDVKPALHIHKNNIQMLRSQPRHRF